METQIPKKTFRQRVDEIKIFLKAKFFGSRRSTLLSILVLVVLLVLIPLLLLSFKIRADRTKLKEVFVETKETPLGVPVTLDTPESKLKELRRSLIDFGFEDKSLAPPEINFDIEFEL